MNTNKNSYTLIYASIVVIIVPFLLAFVSSILGPQSQANERINKKKQILSSLNIRNLENAQVEDEYSKVVLQDEIVNSKGEVVANGTDKDKDGFAISDKEISSESLPVYVCEINGSKKYVFPLVGRGLWGGLSGYIALNDDLNSVYGTYFTHESETAGLGARITEEAFQKQFEGKSVQKDNAIALKVVKNGQVKDNQTECDGITGATLTSNGVSEMLVESLTKYLPFLNAARKGGEL